MSVDDLIDSVLPNKPVLTRKELAEATGTREQTWANWSTEKSGPIYIKIGTSVRYPRPAVVEWLRNNTKLIPQV